MSGEWKHQAVTPIVRTRLLLSIIFFFNDTATTEIYTLSLHDALPISCRAEPASASCRGAASAGDRVVLAPARQRQPQIGRAHSELQSQSNLVCRLLLEKKKKHREMPSRQYITRASM